MAAEETSRLAIVGGGPAASLLAASLLDGARLRRRRLEVAVFDGGAQLGRSPMPLVVNPPAMARLAAMGFPLPAAACEPVGEVRTVLGSAVAEAPFAGYAAARGDLSDGDLPAYLRAGAVGRGARVVPRAVEDVTRVFDGTWALRACGRTERFDAVILACGAGSRLAGTIPGHTPPPVLRACSAMAPLPDALRLHVGNRMIRVIGEGPLPDLWIVPRGPRLHVVAVGPEVDARLLADAVVAAVCGGHLPPIPALGHVRRVLLAAGAARPGLPCAGDALGAFPGELGLSRVATQSQRLAAAFLDGGEDRLLAACREEAAVLRTSAAVHASLRRLWRRRARRTARALQREESRPLHDRPVSQALAAQADPSAPPSASLALSRSLALVWSLLVAAALIAWDRLRGRRPPARRIRSDEIFVVEDDPDQSAALCEYLQARGFTTRAFSDGLGCAAAAAREPPAAVVLDVALPWMDGPAVCRALHRSPATRGVPVLLVTALPPALAGPEAARAGADAVMVKPIDLEKLVRRLGRWATPSAVRRPPVPRRLSRGEGEAAGAGP